ncbi:MAG: MATE family efflux transporter [Clostridia bacterium]|nr:MATE family efflux transporter [Clostridia bacterium]
MKNFFIKYYGDKRFWKTVLRLALPIAIQNLLVSSFSLVDTLMVGALGDLPLSAVGMAGQWGWLFNLFLFGICSGGALFVSQYWGTKDEDSIRRVYGILIASVSILSIVFFAIAFIFPDKVMYIFNKDPKVISEGVGYLRIASFSYLAVALNNALGTMLRSTENVNVPMYSSFFTTIANVILNYAFIFGKFGLPALGVEGAAIATVISSWLGPITIMLIAFMQKSLITRPPLKASRAFTVEFIKRITPAAINEALWGLGTICLNIIFSNYGLEEFAAVTILRTFENVAFVFFVGLCHACCVVVGKYIGEGKIDEAINDSNRFTTLVITAGAILGALIAIFRAPLVSIFNMGAEISDHTLNMAMILMPVYAAELPFKNIPYVQIAGVFRSGGDTMIGVKYDLICLWLIAFPMTLLSAYVFKFPFPLIYASMFIGEDIVKSILCIRYFKKEKWIRPVTSQGLESLEKRKRSKQGL